MDDKNTALQNEAQTLQECTIAIMNLCCRLSPDKAEVNSATIRSLNTQAEALSGEVFNLRKLIDEYSQ